MATAPLPRDQFPVAEQFAYLNHAGVAPIPRCAARAAQGVLDDFLHRGAVDMTAWEERQEVVRASAARLLGAPVTDVAFVKNTSEGLGFVANGLEWQPGDRVLVPDREFPSTALPWIALRDRGVEVELLEPVGSTWDLPLDVFAEALERAPTRLVCVSWVQFARGWRTDIAGLAELCHEHGALLCVDVIQGLGLLPADLATWGVDFAAADAHKWMVGPLGCGVLYVAERCRDLLRPLEPGWASVAHRDEWDNLDLVYDDSARRFEGGSQTLMAIMAMGASIDLLLEADLALVWPHVDGLCERIAAGLTVLGADVLSTRDPAHRAGIVTFSLPGHDPGSLVERLETLGVVASPRGGGVRLSPHGYNDERDVQRLLDAVAAMQRGT